MIDWSRIRELCDEVGPEDFDEVFDLFLEEVQETIDRLEKVPVDLGTLEQDLHFLKGSAMSVGFDCFSRMCGDGETMANNGQASLVQVNEIIGAYNMSKKAFDADVEKELPR